ncbi:MAG: DUF5103 domain-containing protein [Tannerella sp.]|jgi:hypothetical protein|nr:DUF5103 domain-containing protein [Tannerella sp.]
MTKRNGFILLLLCALCLPLQAQEMFKTEIFSPVVKSLQARVEGEQMSLPFIELGGDKALEISFDALNHREGRYAYSIIHCNADWTKSVLTPLEYMDGFDGLPIDDYAQAMTTTTQYYNYRLYLPNENISFKVSGNYIVKVYDEDAPDKVAFTARFFVCEPLVGIQAAVRSNTDISFNAGHQQISFTLDCRNQQINFPQTELKINVLQNNRTDNMVAGIQPSLIGNRKLTYDHIRELIFEAGNEYRRIEFLTHRYNGLGIDKIQYFNPYYHADVIPEKSRSAISYLYDEDQDGRYFINCSGCNEPDTEADYYVVHFTYASERLAGGRLYLLGDFLQNRFNSQSEMEYNADTQQYEKALLMKQGYYNYQYVFVPNGSTRGTLQVAEGNHYETENEYTIVAYYRPPGARYDRIIGNLTFKSK